MACANHEVFFLYECCTMCLSCSGTQGFYNLQTLPSILYLYNNATNFRSIIVKTIPSFKGGGPTENVPTPWAIPSLNKNGWGNENYVHCGLRTFWYAMQCWSNDQIKSRIKHF